MTAGITEVDPTGDLADLDELDATALSSELEQVDRGLAALISYRTELARRYAEARMADGLSGYSHARDLAAVSPYERLGPVGSEIAALLIRLARS